MKKAIALSVALALVSSSAFAATATGTAEIVPLLHRLYAADAAGEPLWWKYQATRLRALFEHEQRVQRATGEALIDEDWLCQCNDPGGIKAKSISVIHRSPTSAVATVRIAGVNGGVYDTVRIEMVREGTWKIADIINKKGQAYTGAIQQELKQYPGR